MELKFGDELQGLRAGQRYRGVDPVGSRIRPAGLVR